MVNLKKYVVNLNVVLLALLCVACGPQALGGGAHMDAPEPGHHAPGADIQLITPQAAIKEVGGSLLFNLGLRVGHPEGHLSVRLGLSEGVDVLGDKHFQFALGDDAIIALPLDLYARAKGRHYLPINAVVELPNGQRLHRAFSVVVQVGRSKPRGKRADQVESLRDSEGRRIKVLPATEDIR